MTMKLSATTAREVGFILAEKVMGWSIHEKLIRDQRGMVIWGWDPIKNLHQAWMVLHQLNERSCWPQMHEKLNRLSFFRLDEHEACVAICEAALECVQ